MVGLKKKKVTYAENLTHKMVNPTDQAGIEEEEEEEEEEGLYSVGAKDDDHHWPLLLS